MLQYYGQTNVAASVVCPLTGSIESFINHTDYIAPFHTTVLVQKRVIFKQGVSNYGMQCTVLCEMS